MCTSPLLLSWLVLCSESLLSRLLLSFGDRAQSTHMQASMLQLKMLRDNSVFMLKKGKGNDSRQIKEKIVLLQRNYR